MLWDCYKRQRTSFPSVSYRHPQRIPSTSLCSTSALSSSDFSLFHGNRRIPWELPCLLVIMRSVALRWAVACSFNTARSVFRAASGSKEEWGRIVTPVILYSPWDKCMEFSGGSFLTHVTTKGDITFCVKSALPAWCCALGQRGTKWFKDRKYV